LIGDREANEQELVDRIRGAFAIGDETIKPPTLILGTVDDITK
jgi:hypothetical protein